ncbi:MAG: tripartite tricarboxylate transporter substrate binding protein [Betaproteobacteria bacterium]|nr:tripartite tricarboxylate transporter substrate binding protein [Betaproteobacteria bacterium]
MSIKSNTCALFIVFAAVCAMPLYAQQNYPARPIRVVVPYTPGGITDVVTRIFAQEVSKAIGQNVLVDNRPGANSILGVEIVSKATADGYTLASVIAAHAANQTLYPKLPYDSIKSFSTVSLLVTAPLIVTATNNLPAKDIKELVALAKAKPGTIAFGSSGIGAAAHLTTELLMLTTGIRMNHVPYKGTAPATQALAGGEIQILIDTPSSMMPHVRSGRIRALGMASEKRVAAAPDIPTLAENGVQVSGGTWVGWLAPAGTPQAAIEKISSEIQAVGKRPDIRDRLIQMGIDPVAGSPAQFDQFLRDEVAKWGRVIKQAGVKIE